MTFKNKVIFGAAASILLIYISITILSYVCIAIISYYGIKHFINKILSLNK